MVSLYPKNWYFEHSYLQIKVLDKFGSTYKFWRLPWTTLRISSPKLWIWAHIYLYNHLLCNACDGVSFSVPHQWSIHKFESFSVYLFDFDPNHDHACFYDRCKFRSSGKNSGYAPILSPHLRFFGREIPHEQKWTWEKFTLNCRVLGFLYHQQYGNSFLAFAPFYRFPHC